MNRKTARALIEVCDFMNGYIGKEIEFAIAAFATLLPIVAAFMMVVIAFA